jgi:hypothetical protein
MFVQHISGRYLCNSVVSTYCRFRSSVERWFKTVITNFVIAELDPEVECDILGFRNS